MHRFELKHFAELLWKSSTTSEEKTPIVSNSIKVPDSGSIAKETDMNEMTDSKSYNHSPLGADNDSGEQGSDGLPKMSLLRKLLFLLSLNGGVVYVAALLWWIPCRHPLCIPQQNWTMNFSDYTLTTNMETKSTKLSSSVLFGFADESGGRLTSLSVMNGTMQWNRTTENILKNVFCDLDASGAKNSDIPYCIVTAYNYMGAFDASNGHMLWEQNITDPSDETIRIVALTKNASEGNYIIAISDDYLLSMHANNGTLLSISVIPCSWTVDVKLVGPWPRDDNDTQWIIVCELGERLEVWTFREAEVLSPPKEPEDLNDVGFHLLFSKGSNVGSIDLAGDVTRTPNSLALSWADIVVMVTDQAPFHHLQKTWERRFTGPLGDSLIVTSIVSGHFTDTKDIQIAVTVQDGRNATLHILQKNNGSTEATANLGMRSIMSMSKVTGAKGQTDTIILESVSQMSSEKERNPSSSLPKITPREYFTAKYTNKRMIFESVVTAEVYASAVNQDVEDATDLFIASYNTDNGTMISRYVLTNKHV
ncbi:uncharacterized protein NPIL_557831 [Nephila pilipes]|uniref:Uncharacterized protein n=1 Tax=Nephila pilipes TaxID=299642 RepID=A0A8X6NT98_NEPPI|nr:uncharacterized protein NPIL_557831 [Nephila pilipes]